VWTFRDLRASSTTASTRSSAIQHSRLAIARSAVPGQSRRARSVNQRGARRAKTLEVVIMPRSLGEDMHDEPPKSSTSIRRRPCLAVLKCTPVARVLFDLSQMLHCAR